MARIKFTGYLDTDDLEPEQVDLGHKTGLSEQGYLDLVQGEGGAALSLSALDDVDSEIVDG